MRDPSLTCAIPERLYERYADGLLLCFFVGDDFITTYCRAWCWKNFWTSVNA